MPTTQDMEPENSFQNKVMEFMQRVAESQGNKEGDLTADIGSLRFSVYQGGTFVDKKTGESLDYEQGIKLKKGTMGLKLSAVEVAFVAQALQDPEFKAELTKRLKIEQQQIQGLKF